MTEFESENDEPDEAEEPDDGDDELLEAQEGKGYGEDEGERGEALGSDPD